jgi:hypothetical protein
MWLEGTSYLVIIFPPWMANFSQNVIHVPKGIMFFETPFFKKNSHDIWQIHVLGGEKTYLSMKEGSLFCFVVMRSTKPGIGWLN